MGERIAMVFEDMKAGARCMDGTVVTAYVLAGALLAGMPATMLASLEFGIWESILFAGAGAGAAFLYLETRITPVLAELEKVEWALAVDGEYLGARSQLCDVLSQASEDILKRFAVEEVVVELMKHEDLEVRRVCTRRLIPLLGDRA